MPEIKPKCPYCPSKKFNIGKIILGQDGSAEVICCARCGSIVSYSENTLKKPSAVMAKPTATFAELKGL